MKLIPNKGYVVLKSYKFDDRSDGLIPPPTADGFYEVTEVSEDSPLCQAGDVVIVSETLWVFQGKHIAREEDILAWVEDEDAV